MRLSGLPIPLGSSSHVKVMEGNKREPDEILRVSPRASHLDDQIAHLLEFGSYQPSPADDIGHSRSKGGTQSWGCCTARCTTLPVHIDACCWHAFWRSQQHAFSNIPRGASNEKNPNPFT
jgi:hypothetical protein